MRQSKWLIALSLVALYGSLDASPAEHIVWDKTPIDVNLSLTDERFVHFPQAISIIDSEEKENIAILKVRDSLYLKAKKAFAHKRLVVQLMPQGDVIILSLSANEKITLTPPLDISIDQKDGDANSANNTDNTKTNLDINAITLTRFAIQSLYAPERLLKDIQQVFKPLANPQVPIYIFPHIALIGDEQLLKPGYTTAFFLYKHNQFALPSEYY